MAKKDQDRILAVRQQVNEQRRREAAAAKRRRLITQLSVIVGVVAIAAVIVGLVFMFRDSQVPQVPTAEPTTITVGSNNAVPMEIQEHGVKIGAADAKVSLEIYEDFSCPHCATYHAQIGSTLTQLVADGKVTIQYNPINIVTKYGERAGSTAACVAVNEPNKWYQLRGSLFDIHDANTDAWGYTGFRDYLSQLGYSNETLSCVTDARYASWIRGNTDAARQAGITSTPTLKINGEAVELVPGDILVQLVDGLIADAS